MKQIKKKINEDGKIKEESIFNVTAECETCHHQFTFLSTKKAVKVDVCSNCHPFYNNQSVFKKADSRVQKFNTKYNKNY